MCNDFKVILKVENIDEESKNIFEQDFKELIVKIKNVLELEINTLDRVILTEDYKNELELLKEEGIDESFLKNLEEIGYTLFLDITKINAITYNPQTKILVEKNHSKQISITLFFIKFTSLLTLRPTHYGNHKPNHHKNQTFSYGNRAQ